MPTQVLNRYTLALAGLLAAGVVLHLVALPAGDPGFIRDSFDMGHVLGFAALSWLLVRTLETGPLRGRPAAAAYVGAAAIAGLLAVAAEAVQIAGPRDADLADVVSDAIGAAAGLLVALALVSGGRARAGTLAAAVLLVIGGIAAPAASLFARGLAHAHFPVLADFELPFEARLAKDYSACIARVPAPDGWPHAGHVARIVTAGTRRYEGAAFDRWPRDWSGYETLVFTLAAEPAAAVTVGIHDTEHDNRVDDRFNRTFEIGPEPETVRIPLAEVRAAPAGRQLDLTRVAGVVFFMVNRDRVVLHIDRLRLE